MNPNTHNRKTGRTTRMIAHAVSTLASGRSVDIIAATGEYARTLFDHVRREMHDKRLKAAGVKVTPCPTITLMSGQRLRILSVGSAEGRMDWRRCEPNQMSPGSLSLAVLVDHYTIETELATTLAMLHQFDAPGTIGGAR